MFKYLIDSETTGTSQVKKRKTFLQQPWPIGCEEDQSAGGWCAFQRPFDGGYEFGVL